MPPPQVTVAKPLVRDITDWDEFTGRLAAVESVEIRARIDGYLQSVNFSEGALVRQGDLLFVIDPRPLKAALDAAEATLKAARARLELAQHDLENGKRLIESHTISARDFDAITQGQREAAADVDAAMAARETARLNLAYARIHAPIGGRIGRALFTVGNLVRGSGQESTLLTTIVSLDPIHVLFTADEQAYLRYQRLAEKGVRPSSRNAPNPVRLQLADEQGFPHAGHMDFVDNQLDQGTGTIEGRAVFPNPDGLLTPGLFARVRLLGEGPYRALLVPDQAIGTDQAQRIVYVVDDKKAVRPQAVRLGRMVGELRVIREGLNADDRVVISGLQRIRPGVPVDPVEGTIP
jgi:multidrug efflux system membrane fusion protein